MEIHFLVKGKSWKIIVEKEWPPCRLHESVGWHKKNKLVTVSHSDAIDFTR